MTGASRSSILAGMHRTLAIAALLFGCSSTPDVPPSDATQSPAPNAAATTAEPGRLVVTVRARGEVLRVLSTRAGLRFSVLGDDGRTVSTALRAEELASRHEHLHLLYRQGYAQNEPFLDARLDLPIGDVDAR